MYVILTTKFRKLKNAAWLFLCYNQFIATVAQLAEQLIRNEQVAGSIPVGGSIFLNYLFKDKQKQISSTVHSSL